MDAAALQGELGAAARTPLVAGLTEAPSSSMTSAAANAGSSAMSGAAPLAAHGVPGVRRRLQGRAGVGHRAR